MFPTALVSHSTDYLHGIPQSWGKSGHTLGMKIFGFETWFLLVTTWGSFSKLLTYSLPHSFHACKNGAGTDYLLRFLQGSNRKQFGKLQRTLQVSPSSLLFWLSQWRSQRANGASRSLYRWRNEAEGEGFNDLPKVTQPCGQHTTEATKNQPGFSLWSQRFRISLESLALEVLELMSLWDWNSQTAFRSRRERLCPGHHVLVRKAHKLDQIQPVWVNNILLEHSRAHSFTNCLWLLSYYDGRLEWSQ